MTEPQPPSFAPELEPQRASERRRRHWVLGSLLGLFLGGPALGALWLTQPGVRALAVPPIPQVSEAHLKAHVVALSQDFLPRNHRNVAQLDRTAAYIADHFQRSGGRVSEQTFTVQGRTYRNVCARFGPERGARVVVGAHYDAYQDLPGADDNASGVAGLLELARCLQQHPVAAPVELVAYTLEEPPYFRTRDMGSAHHARHLKTQGVAIRAMLCLEMIGYFSDAPGSQRFPIPLVGSLYPDRGNFIAVVGRLGDASLTRTIKAAMRGASTLDVRSMNAPRWVRGTDFSDHHPYWNEGYPAVMISDGAFFRNTAYHTAQDTADRLDYRRMAQVVQGVWAAVWALGSPSS